MGDRKLLHKLKRERERQKPDQGLVEKGIGKKKSGLLDGRINRLLDGRIIGLGN